ncbi:MAG: cytochrome c3 family protein [Nitrospirota bacterium]
MNFQRHITLIIGYCIFIVLVPVVAGAIGIKNTKHNLSVSGPGPVGAITESEICKFCHTPHNASPSVPLWNHVVTTEQNYVNYWSPTLKSYPSQEAAPPVDGFSRLCLSCHDGTVALGALVSREEEIETVPDVLTESIPGYLGTDLSGGHPISIIFDSALANLRNSDPNIMHLNWPINDPDVQLYSTQNGSGVQCTSCHDPHGGKGGTEAPPFWRKTTYDEVCLVCHDITSTIGH